MKALLLILVGLVWLGCAYGLGTTGLTHLSTSSDYLPGCFYFANSGVDDQGNIYYFCKSGIWKVPKLPSIVFKLSQELNYPFVHLLIAFFYNRKILQNYFAIHSLILID